MSIRRKRIAYICWSNPLDPRSWSGVHRSMFNSLQRHVGDVVWERRINALFGKIVNHGSRLGTWLTGSRWSLEHNVALSKMYARSFQGWLSGKRFDVIVAPAASTALAFLQTRIPIIYASDTTFSLMCGYYAQYSNLTEHATHGANLIERRSIQTAAKLLYPTSWAAESAIRDYGADPGAVHIAPFGPNLADEDIPPATHTNRRGVSRTCRLLLVGVDWERKGGPLAFETLLELEKMGVDARLTICGCTPPNSVNHPRMSVIPFLNKRSPRQRCQLARLYVQADFLLLPTRQECAGVVFSEASAFALPSITTDTGGVSGVVRNGQNGFLLASSANAVDYAATIKRLIDNPSQYEDLCRSSRHLFDTHLNWTTWGSRVRSVVNQLT